MSTIINRLRNKKNQAFETADKQKTNKSQLLNFTEDSYLERTSRPFYSLIFVLPFIALYEFGTFYINTDVSNQSQIRVVAFVWLQNLLESIGFSGKYAWAAPPFAIIIILLSLQFTSGKKWKFSFSDLLPMLIECVLLAVPLIVLTLFLSSAKLQINFDRLYGYKIKSQANVLPMCTSISDGNSGYSGESTNNSMPEQSLAAKIVTGIGAGIYEELVFRLILICFLLFLFQDIIRTTHINSIVLSVLISAGLFSAHHHINFFNGQMSTVDPFDFTRFVFRTIAGIYFAILFAFRGFGITAGTHAFYNIIAVFITARFFQ